MPGWLDAVGELFPREAKEILERELIARRGLGDLLSNPGLLEKIEPSVDMVEILLHHKDLLRPETRAAARAIVARVASALQERLRVQTATSLSGALRRDRKSPRRIFRNLDLKTTIRRNLRHWDADRGALLVDRTFFFASERKIRPWHVVVCVDQSGSMAEALVHAAVMASIFAVVPSLRASLVLFDTRVVDLSDRAPDPVEVLMSAQLGGGTHIAGALGYCEGLIREPRRTLVVLVTDFQEGGPSEPLVAQVRRLSESGVRVLGLGALGYDAIPQIDERVAKACVKAGMDLLLCTPERLVESMARIIGGR